MLLDRAISRPPAGPSAQGGVARVTSMAQWHPYSAASLCLHQNGWLQTIAALLLRTGNDRAPIPPAFLQSRRRLICPPQQRSPRTNFPTHFRSSEGLALGLAWAGEGGKQATPHAGPPIEAQTRRRQRQRRQPSRLWGKKKAEAARRQTHVPCPCPCSRTILGRATTTHARSFVGFAFPPTAARRRPAVIKCHRCHHGCRSRRKEGNP